MKKYLLDLASHHVWQLFINLLQKGSIVLFKKKARSLSVLFLSCWLPLISSYHGYSASSAEIKGSSDSEANLDIITSLSQAEQLDQKTMKSLLGLSQEQLKGIITSIELNHLNRAYNSISKAGLDTQAEYAESFGTIAEIANERNRKIKSIMVPPFETIYILDNDNADAFLAKEGRLYSRLKYGDQSVIEDFARKMSQRIISRFGSDLVGDREHWTIASAGFYRSPNAASYLGDLIAEQLDLGRAELRAHGVFTGEFGGVSDMAQRMKIVKNALFVSNPNKVKGRKVIYIDDVFVSGAHLAEHENLLKEAGAQSVHSFAIFDVASSDLTLEKALNYALVDANNPSTLIDIIKKPGTPILTRTAKFILRLSQTQLASFAAALPDQKVFEVFEAAEAENYGQHKVFHERYKQLEQIAVTRHKAMDTAKTGKPQDTKLLISDFDGTLAPALSPLSNKMAENIIRFLDEGGELAVVTMQPIVDNGISEFTLEPLRQYLISQNRNFDILSRLHLFAGGGLSYYRVVDGVVDPKDPEANVGVNLDDWSMLEAQIEKNLRALASKIYYRGSYVSLHFKDTDSLAKAQEKANEIISPFPKLVTEQQYADGKIKKSFHIKMSDTNKVIARTKILGPILRTLRSRVGKEISRSEMAVFGDKLGTTPGDNDDSGLFILGSRNYAVGKEARPGADTIYLNTCASGIEKWFEQHFSN